MPTPASSANSTFQAVGHRPTATTAAVMFALARGKARTGAALDNPAPRSEGRVTLTGGRPAAAVLLGLLPNSVADLWWADPAAGYVLGHYALREVKEIFFGEHRRPGPPGHTLHCQRCGSPGVNP